MCLLKLSICAFPTHPAVACGAEVLGRGPRLPPAEHATSEVAAGSRMHEHCRARVSEAGIFGAVGRAARATVTVAHNHLGAGEARTAQRPAINLSVLQSTRQLRKICKHERKDQLVTFWLARCVASESCCHNNRTHEALALLTLVDPLVTVSVDDVELLVLAARASRHAVRAAHRVHFAVVAVARQQPALHFAILQCSKVHEFVTLAQCTHTCSDAD